MFEFVVEGKMKDDEVENVTRIGSNIFFLIFFIVHKKLLKKYTH